MIIVYVLLILSIVLVAGVSSVLRSVLRRYCEHILVNLRYDSYIYGSIV